VCSSDYVNKPLGPTRDSEFLSQLQLASEGKIFEASYGKFYSNIYLKTKDTFWGIMQFKVISSTIQILRIPQSLFKSEFSY
jgi:hypothetical protein